MSPGIDFSVRSGAFVLLLALVVPALGQDRAATESESGWTDSTWAASDPLRSEELIGLQDGSGLLHGAEHLQHFLPAWRHLLQPADDSDSPHAPLHILHFGGSHVQAGRIGWAFRQAIELDRPGIHAVRGVLPPHRLAGENGPPEIRWSSGVAWSGQRSAHRRHQGEWGLTGLEVSSDHPDTVRMWCDAMEDCPERADILTRPDESTAWSIVGGANSAWGDTLLLIPPDSGGAHLQGLLLHHPRADVVYHDLGGNGASTAAWLRHPHLVDQLRATGGDLAILAWGINDAHMPPERFSPERFKARYRQLMDSLRAAVPDIDILLVTNNDSHYRSRHNPNAERVRTAMLELVEECNVACWDLYRALGGAHSMAELHRAGFAASDHLHFNRNGYILIGELLYTTLTRAALRPNAPPSP